MKDAGDEDLKRAVTDWESKDPKELNRLFDKWLYRIMNWSKKRRTHIFSANDIHEFKGVPFDSRYPFGVRAMAAMPKDGGDASQFQIGEDFVEGHHFFQMITHYLKLMKKCEGNALMTKFPEIVRVLNCNDGKGFEHVELMFRCALMAYIDRFGEEALEDGRAIRKICLWAFMLRLNLSQITEDSVNKYAVSDGEGDYTNRVPMISVIKSARTPSDVAVADVVGVNSGRFTRHDGMNSRMKKDDGTGNAIRTGLFNALKKVED